MDCGSLTILPILMKRLLFFCISVRVTVVQKLRIMKAIVPKLRSCRAFVRVRARECREGASVGRVQGRGLPWAVKQERQNVSSFCL